MTTMTASFDRDAAIKSHDEDRKLLESIRSQRDNGAEWGSVEGLGDGDAEARQFAWEELMERAEQRVEQIKLYDQAKAEAAEESARSAQVTSFSPQLVTLSTTAASSGSGAPMMSATRDNPNEAKTGVLGSIGGAPEVKEKYSMLPADNSVQAPMTFAEHIREAIGNPAARNQGMAEIKIDVGDKPDMRNFYNPDDHRERWEHEAMMRGQGLLMGDTRAVDTASIPTAHTQQMGIVTSRAEFYASGRLPMVYANEMRARGDQWNEDNTSVATPTVTTGEVDAAVDYSPTTIQRQIYPADSRIVIKVSKRSLMNRSDWEDYLQFKLMQKFWEVTSPEAIHSAGTLTGLVSVGNAAFHQSSSNADPVQNPMNGITKTSYSISSSKGKGVAIADAVGDALDTMGGLAPGPKSIICRRQFASAYRRDLGTAFGVALQRSGMMNLDIEGASLAPVDVGFETEANNKLQAVISDFATSSEFLISWLEVQILYETAAKTGQLEFLLNIGRAFRWDSRFQFGLVFAKT